MSIAISDAIQQARQAVEDGDYRSAIQSCNQLVNQFPDYAAAYRVLGEAYLEQGQTADAEQAFAQSLLRDPRQPWVYHGLGLIAEEQNVLDNALAFCQVAWELAPNFAQLRDPVIRIATRRYGADGQAQLTGAALAQIYANTARLQRAAVEYRGALAELPDRLDLKLGLAETLWLLHKNDDAADVCREVLQDHPATIQALVILADIEGRAGNSAEATDLRARVRATDPDGAITATMLSRNAHADSATLLLAPDAMPVVDETAGAVVAERPHIAPAPDFGYQPSRAEQPAQDIEDLQPISAEEFGSDVAEFENAVNDAAEMAMQDLDTAELTSATPVETFQDDAPSIYRTDIDEAVFGLQQESQGLESPDAQLGAEAEDDDFAALTAELGDVEPMAIEEFGAEPEDVERLAAAESDMLNSDDDLFSDLMSPFPNEGTAADHLSNLASALEDDVAGVLDRAGEQPAEESQSDAPSADAASGTGYTTVLRELGDEGFKPFDPMGRQETTAQPTEAHDLAAEGDESAPAVDDLARLTEDWDSIDDEIARAVPMTTGHTDRLRAADDLGIAPFDFETEDDTSRLPAYRPFGEDDSEINAEADVEVVAEAEVTAEAEAEVEPVSSTVTPALENEDLLDTLQPFSMEEFDDDAKDEQPFSFASLPWESNPGGSAVPSDEDFEALLLSEEAPAVVTAPDATSSQPAETVDWTTAIQDDVPSEQAPAPAAFDLPPAWGRTGDWDTSLAVTRQIGGEQEAPDERMAAAEAAASDALAAHDAGQAVETHISTTGLFRNVDPEKLAADEELFERVRSAKTDLVAQGTISGDRLLVEEEPEPAIEPEPQPVGWFDAAPSDDDFVVGTGASRDINTLRASLQASPNDDELHWWLAEALRAHGNVDDAYGEYRWLVRNASHRAEDVINALNACVEQEQHAEMGHRLLADLYRRRGAVSLASSHAATAMAVRRRLRG